MIKESKYIIRRIIVAVGVILLMSFINSCKVKAFSYDDNYIKQITDSGVTYRIYYNDENDSIDYFRNGNVVRQIDISGKYFIFTNAGLINYWQVCDDEFIINATDNVISFFNNSQSTLAIRSSDLELSYNNDNSCNMFMMRPDYPNNNYSNTAFDIYYNGFSSYFSSYSNYVLKNYNDYVVSDEKLNFINTGINSSPEFLSFNAIFITHNNVITSYTIQPEFTTFDTNNYIYQYSFDNDIWLSFSENQQLLRINNNSTIYVRIKDLSNNEIIDTANLTISRIGTFYNDQDYDINFSGEARTSNDLNNNSSGKSSVIMNYQIYVDYKPKSSILIYQYQYVNSGSSLDNNNWENVSSSDNGSITYVATQNGVLYARILDKENTILKTASFNVNSIGKLAIDNNSSGVGGLFDRISSKVNFTGPISSIINVPIQLITTISIGLGGGLTCTDYPIGSLWGTNLVIPCVNIKQHLGNSLYTTIDLIISCCMIYYIIKMFGEIYTNLLFMQKNPIQDLGKRGD